MVGRQVGADVVTWIDDEATCNCGGILDETVAVADVDL